MWHIDCKRRCRQLDDEEGVTESESDDSESQESGEHESDQDCEVIGAKETAIAHEEVQRLANQTVNAPRQEGPRSEASQKKLRAP